MAETVSECPFCREHLTEISGVVHYWRHSTDGNCFLRGTTVPENWLPAWNRRPPNPAVAEEALATARRMEREIIANRDWSFTGDEVLTVARALLAKHAAKEPT